MAAVSYTHLDVYKRQGIFDKVIMAHSGAVPENLALMASGKIQVEFCPMGTIAERIRAGGMGLGGILVKTGLGTVAPVSYTHLSPATTSTAPPTSTTPWMTC